MPFCFFDDCFPFSFLFALAEAFALSLSCSFSLCSFVSPWWASADTYTCKTHLKTKVLYLRNMLMQLLTHRALPICWWLWVPPRSQRSVSPGVTWPLQVLSDPGLSSWRPFLSQYVCGEGNTGKEVEIVNVCICLCWAYLNCEEMTTSISAFKQNEKHKGKTSLLRFTSFPLVFPIIHLTTGWFSTDGTKFIFHFLHLLSINCIQFL